MLQRNVFAAFLNFCAVERQLSSHTCSAYKSDLSDFQCWLRVQQKTSCSTDDLKLYLEDMVGRKLAIATMRRRLACLRAFFRWQAERSDMPDPFTGWRPALPRPRRLPRTLSRPEAKFLLTGTHRYAADTILVLGVRLMISGGMRVGELCGLRLEDVSPDGETLRIHGKGSRDRVVFVSDTTLRRDLSAFLRARRKQAAAGAPLLLNARGAPLRPASLRAKLRRAAGEVGIGRRVTPHMLRHTAATLLIETGVDIRFVQRLLGHSSIATTEIYTHVSDQALKATLERADVLRSVSGG
jgi:integrase/recombinase XerD